MVSNTKSNILLDSSYNNNIHIKIYKYCYLKKFIDVIKKNNVIKIFSIIP